MQVIMRNIEALGEHHDLITITPPGKSLLPWDEAHCADRGPHKHSGPDGCRVRKQALDRWMQDRDRKLTLYLDAAKTRASRATNEPRAESVLTPELQDRGAAHWHIALGAQRRVWNLAFMEALKDLAGDYGFGRPAFDPHRHGGGGLNRYLSKLGAYLGKATKDGNQEQLDALREALEVYGMRTCRVSPSVTRRTYATMRNHRLKRWGHHRLAESGMRDYRLTCQQARELYDSATANRQKYLDGLRLAAAQALEDHDEEKLDLALNAMRCALI